MVDEETKKMNGAATSKYKSILLAVLAMPLLGVLYDALNGFHILKHSKSAYGVVFGLFLTAVYAVIGESISNWVNLKDDVSQPLHKRALNLSLLLLLLTVVAFSYWFVFNCFG